MNAKQSALIVRSTAGLALLLWLACPVCLVIALWDGEWKWAATGVAAFLTGSVVAVVMLNGMKQWPKD